LINTDTLAGKRPSAWAGLTGTLRLAALTESVLRRQTVNRFPLKTADIC
jgi:hypothetical protein